MELDRINTKIDADYPSYPKQLRMASKYVRENPEAVALHSLRQLSDLADVHPSTLMRLVRELGFERYNEFREPFKLWLSAQGNRMSGRVDGLRRRGQRGELVSSVTEVFEHDQSDLKATIDQLDTKDLLTAARLAVDAERIFILGFGSLHSAAFLLDYSIKMFSPKSVLIDGRGGTLGDEIRFVTPRDVVIVLSHRSYSVDALRIAEYAKAAGARLISIVDSPLAPTAALSDVKLLVAAHQAGLLTSIVSTLAVVQALITAIVSEVGDEIDEKMKLNENYFRIFEKYVDV